MLLLQRMQEQCPICNTKFDNDSHVPMLICSLQHFTCYQCYQRLIKYDKNDIKACPECRQQIDISKVVKFRLLIKYNQQLERQKQRLRKQAEQDNQKFMKQTTADFQQIFQIFLFNSPQDLDYCCLRERTQQLIEEGSFQLTISLLKLLIEHAHNIPQFACQKIIGIGSKQEETGLSENCGIDWYRIFYHPLKLSSFDLLNYLFLRYTVDEGEWLQRMQDKFPSDYRIKYSNGLFYHNKGDLQKAKIYYKQVIELCHDFPKSYEMLAFIFYKQNQQKQSLQYALCCQARDSQNIYAQFIVATLSNDPVLNLTEFYKTCTNYARVPYKIAKQLFKQGHYEQALLKCDESFAINNRYDQSLILKGQILSSSKSYRQALTCFKAASQINQAPETQLTMYNLIGLCYINLADYKKAIETFLYCLKISPEDIKTKQDLGKAYIKQKMYMEALDIFLKLQSMQKGNVQIIKSIIYCYGLTNRKKEIIWIKKLQAIEPGNRTAHFDLANSLWKNDQLQESLKHLNKCIEDNYKLNEVYTMKIDILVKLGKHEQSLKVAGECIQVCELKPEEYEGIFKRVQAITRSMKR